MPNEWLEVADIQTATKVNAALAAIVLALDSLRPVTRLDCFDALRTLADDVGGRRGGRGA